MQNVNNSVLLGLQKLLKIVRSKNQSEYEPVLSELADALNLNRLGTKCKCGYDISFCSKIITCCGNCDIQ